MLMIKIDSHVQTVKFKRLITGATHNITATPAAKKHDMPEVQLMLQTKLLFVIRGSPGCGSAWKKPCVSSCCRYDSTDRL